MYLNDSSGHQQVEVVCVRGGAVNLQLIPSSSPKMTNWSVSPGLWEYRKQCNVKPRRLITIHLAWHSRWHIFEIFIWFGRFGFQKRLGRWLDEGSLYHIQSRPMTCFPASLTILLKVKDSYWCEGKHQTCNTAPQQSAKLNCCKNHKEESLQRHYSCVMLVSLAATSSSSVVGVAFCICFLPTSQPERLTGHWKLKPAMKFQNCTGSQRSNVLVLKQNLVARHSGEVDQTSVPPIVEVRRSKATCFVHRCKNLQPICQLHDC